MLKRLFRILLIFLLVGSLGGAGALWWLAGQFVSPPRSENPGIPVVVCLEIEERTLVDGTTPTLIVKAKTDTQPGPRALSLRSQLGQEGLAPAPFGEAERMLILLHGRMGRKEYLVRVAERYCAAGFICVIPDLPGHGQSSIGTNGFGAGPDELGLVSQIAEEVSQAAGKRLPISLWGMSMGGSFAIQAAARDPQKWDRIVLVSTFDSLGSLLEEKLNNRLYAVLAKPFIRLRGGFDLSAVNSVDLADSVMAPTKVVHGDADELISLERAGKLYGALNVKKTFMTVPGGTHQNVLVTDAPVYARTAAWLLGAE